MNKPLFDIAVIARNEATTLPRLVNSVKEFMDRGGNFYVLDTGSTDNTIEVAKSLGCKVEAVGDKFRIQIDGELADKINAKFVVEGETPVVNAGESLFDFASARNYIAEFTENHVVATPDCDEIFTKFDIDKLNEAIENGAEQLEYEFVFSHDDQGNPIIKFRHCKFYNKKKLHWVNIIHETLSGAAKQVYLGEDIIKLEHYQNVTTNRSGYLKGLAVDCFNRPDDDRASHYFAREMFYLGRYKSAIKEFNNHISMNRWPTEAAQSMLYIGDAYKALGDNDEALKWYSKSIEKEARREPFMRLAEYYFSKDMHRQVIAYCEAALSVTQLPFYSNHQPYYEHVPHELLYISYWWAGEKTKSKEHYLKALALCPTNPKYIDDGKFYHIESKPMVYVTIPTTKERRPRLQKAIDSIRNSDYPNITLVVHEGVHPGSVESVHAMLEGIDGLSFGLSDDNWIEPDCITKLVDAYLKAFPDGYGFAQTYNEIQGSRLVTAGMCHSSWAKKYIYKGYVHNWSDNEFTEIVDSLNKHIYVPNAIVHHDHFSLGKADFDKTYESNQVAWEKDHALYLQRKANNFEPKNV